MFQLRPRVGGRGTKGQRSEFQAEAKGEQPGPVLYAASTEFSLSSKWGDHGQVSCSEGPLCLPWRPAKTDSHLFPSPEKVPSSTVTTRFLSNASWKKPRWSEGLLKSETHSTPLPMWCWSHWAQVWLNQHGWAQRRPPSSLALQRWPWSAWVGCPLSGLLIYVFWHIPSRKNIGQQTSSVINYLGNYGSIPLSAPSTLS